VSAPALEGVDFSTSRPSGICLYASGKRFVVRYFGPGSSGKHATAKEIAAYRAVGLDVVACAEGNKLDPLQGRLMGREHAKSADLATLNAGMPADRPIYFAADFDVTPKQAGAVTEYFRGCADEIGWDRVGAYAGYDFVEYAAGQGVAAWFWQTYAWSGKNVSRFANLYQYSNGRTVCGADVDLNRALSLDYGQWGAPAQVLGQVATAPPDTTVDTGWDFTPHVDALAGQSLDVATVLSQYARATDALGDG
jgi:hypothetical protein